MSLSAAVRPCGDPVHAAPALLHERRRRRRHKAVETQLVCPQHPASSPCFSDDILRGVRRCFKFLLSFSLFYFLPALFSPSSGCLHLREALGLVSAWNPRSPLSPRAHRCGSLLLWRRSSTNAPLFIELMRPRALKATGACARRRAKLQPILTSISFLRTKPKKNLWSIVFK